MWMILLGIFLVLIYYAYLFLWNHSWQRYLKVAVTFSSQTVFEGDFLYVEEVVQNQSMLSFPLFEVSIPLKESFATTENKKDYIPLQRDLRQLYSLKGKEEIVRQVPLKAVKRGIYPLKDLEIRSREFFTTRQGMVVVPFYQEMIIYPKYLTPTFITRTWEKGLGETLAHFSLFQDPLAVRNLRQMAPTDSLRQINWKKSAQYNEWYVNQYEAVTNQSVTLILYLPEKVDWHHEKLLETSISILITVAKELLLKGVTLEILSNGANKKGETLYFPQLKNIDPLLYGCAGLDIKETKPVEELFQRLNQEEEKRLIICSSGKDLYRPLYQLFTQNYYFQTLWLNAVFEKSEEKLAENVLEVEIQ